MASPAPSAAAPPQSRADGLPAASAIPNPATKATGAADASSAPPRPPRISARDGPGSRGRRVGAPRGHEARVPYPRAERRHTSRHVHERRIATANVHDSRRTNVPTRVRRTCPTRGERTRESGPFGSCARGYLPGARGNRCTGPVDAVPGPAGPGRVPRSPVLVGRAAELATARGLVDAVADGRGGALLVAGEAGIGKTRLLDEVAGRARERGLPVLSGRAVQGGGTFRAVAGAVIGLLDDPAQRPEPRRCAPTAPRSPGCCPAGRKPDGGIGRRPAPTPSSSSPRACCGCCASRSATAPGCVLRLEDLHWADDDTLALVEHLASAAADSPVLLACSARDDAPAHAARRLAAAPGTITLHLARLSGRDVAALAAACRGGRPVTDEEAERLLLRSDGLPFAVEELARRSGLGRPAHPRRARRRPARGAPRPGPGDPAHRRRAGPRARLAPARARGRRPRSRRCRAPCGPPSGRRCWWPTGRFCAGRTRSRGTPCSRRCCHRNVRRWPGGWPECSPSAPARTTSRAPPNCSSRRARRTPR